MDILDKVSGEELYKFGELVQYYAIDSGDGICNKKYPHNVNSIKLLQEWAAQKSEYLYQMLGQNLIVSKDIVCSKNKEEMIENITNLLGRRNMTIYDSFESLYSDLINRIARKWNAEKDNHMFIQSEDDIWYSSPRSSAYPWQYAALSLIEAEALYENRYKYSNAIKFPLKEEGKYLLINNGMKAMRALNKIAISYGWEKEFEDFRLRHSRILNDSTLKGTLTLSIHPLDYATASMNDSKWRSCMDWDMGEFRRGTVEMMNSPMVVVAYLTHGKNTFINRFGDEKFWNNKKWREFFIVSPQVGIVAIKGYPYWNHELEDITINWIKELMDTNLPNFMPEFDEDIINFKANGGEVYFKNHYSINFETNAMYNDFCYDEHRGLFIKNLFENDRHYMVINYSGASECLECGYLYDYDEFDGESALVCNNCQPIERCYQCDSIIHEDEGYWIDGEHLCEYCAENLPECQACGDLHFSHSLNYFNVIDKNGVARKYETCLCDICSDSTVVKEAITKGKNTELEGYPYEVSFIDLRLGSDRLARKLGYEDIEELNDYASATREYKRISFKEAS